MLLPFALRSVIIYCLSAEYLGLNSLFSSILQVLNLTELGFGSAIVYSMYKPIADNDVDTVCGLLNFYKRVYSVIGGCILGVGLCLLPFLKHLISGEYPADINLYIVYLCYLANTVLSYWLFAYKNSLLNAYQRTDVLSKISTVTLGSMYALQILVLLITRNYYLFAIIMPLCTAFQNIVIAYVTKKMFPQYICRGSVSKTILSNIKKQISGLMVTKICAVTRNSFDSIFVSAYLGLTITAMYGNYYYIMNAIIGVLMAVSNSILAGVGNSIITDSTEKNYADLKKFNFLYMWMAGWCTVCLACLYQPFMYIWVGSDLMFPYPIVIAFCIYFYALEIGVIRGVYSDAAGLWWENRYRAIAESVTNIILNYIFVLKFGVMGIIVATLISLLIINFGFGSQIVFKYYFKNGKLMEYFALHLLYAGVTAVICVITYIGCGFIATNGIFGFVEKVVVCLILPNIFYVLIYHSTAIYQQSMIWLTNALRIPKKIRRLLFLQ